jgi:predicted DNA-binding transcriptional regulator AlpA
MSQQSKRKIAAISAAIPDALKNFDSLPDSANVRQPVLKGLLNCSDATVWRRVNDGILPQPTRLGRMTFWNVGELRKALASLKGSMQ